MVFLVIVTIRIYSNYTSAKVSIALFASISLLLLIATLINSLLCILNFDKGLKIHVNPPDNDPASLELKQMDTPTRFLLS